MLKIELKKYLLEKKLNFLININYKKLYNLSFLK